MTLASGSIATLDAAPSSVPSAASRAVAMPSAVVFDRVSFAFDDHVVLRDISSSSRIRCATRSTWHRTKQRAELNRPVAGSDCPQEGGHARELHGAPRWAHLVRRNRGRVAGVDGCLPPPLPLQDASTLVTMETTMEAVKSTHGPAKTTPLGMGSRWGESASSRDPIPA